MEDEVRIGLEAAVRIGFAATECQSDCANCGECDECYDEAAVDERNAALHEAGG